MSAVTTEIANALDVAEYRVYAIRPGEALLEVPLADLPWTPPVPLAGAIDH